MDQPRATPPHWMNTLVRWGLRTPGLQRWLGRSTALLTFRGRLSDRLFTTPVAYARDGERVLVTCHVRRQWWRNLRVHPDVAVRLVGEQHNGHARVLRGLEALDAYLTYLQARPRIARAAGIDLGDGEPDPRQAQAALRSTKVVGIDLGRLVTELPVQVDDRG